MGSVSNPTAAFPQTYVRRKGKRKDVAKDGDAAENPVGVERIGIDWRSLGTMTVKELRELARSVGVPAEGSKKDLVSALECYSSTVHDSRGPYSVSIPEDMPLADMMLQLKQTTSKVKAGSLAARNIRSTTLVSEVADCVQKRRRKKQTIRGGTVHSEVRESKEVEKVFDNISSCGTKRMSSEIQMEVTAECQSSPLVSAREPWTIFAHKRPQKEWAAYNPRAMRPPPLAGGTQCIKLMSWNVNGLRGLLKMDGFSALVAKSEDFDVLCLQETKIQDKDVGALKGHLIDGYHHSYWTCSSSKLGYSGTAVISRIKPISVSYGLGMSCHDSEGRLVTVEFDKFYLVNAYVPNSGDGLRRLDYRVKEWDAYLSNHVKDLDKLKPVILTGDLNCAHQEIDIYNPAGNRRSAGFTDEERESFQINLLSRGFVDTFRKQHPNVVGYTYWGYRHGGRKTNKGWRLDYFLVSESIIDKVHDSYIVPDITGSDHCPIGLILEV